MKNEEIIKELDKLIMDHKYDSSEQREAICEAIELIKELEK